MVYTVTGKLSGSQIVNLDKPLPICEARVRVTVEEIPESQKPTLWEAMRAIRESQRLRGHVPPSADEVDRYLEEERNSWDR